jgi:hypothetical protein
MNKFLKLGLRRNELHLNCKQKDFKEGNHKGPRILPTQSHLQTLNQVFFVKSDFAMHAPTMSPTTS